MYPPRRRRPPSGDRDDPECLRLPWRLMDVRQYDADSAGPDELQPRLLRMFALLGPKLGQFWALLIDSQLEHVVRGRLLQRLVQDMIPRSCCSGTGRKRKNWLEAMTKSAARGKSLHEQAGLIR
jgi:hypothetical protein